jgi:hypothetical protein
MARRGNEVRPDASKPELIARALLPKTIIGIVLGAAIICTIDIGTTDPAVALPSFARQTGLACGSCHTDFPGLTPVGRQFKLGGYTMGGGKFRSTLFPSQNDSTKALGEYAKKSESGMPTKAPSSDTSQINPYAPPISMMAIVGFTHTQAPQDPTGSPYSSNDNVVVAPVSLFYGGAITDHIGAFAQLTYNNAPFGAQDPADPYTSKLWTWDNTDVRYANTGNIGNLPVTYGITANNNPSVQDVWNTTPAWSFPYAVSNIAPRPSTGALIDGAFAAHVGGVGAYAWINNLVYLELSGYRTINSDTQAKLGADPFHSAGMFDGVAPYWRVAVEPHWGNHWLEFGAFGMSARVHPWTFSMDPTSGFYNNETFPQTDRFTDVAFDSQYQYQGPNYWITLRGAYIHEDQTLDASFANGLSANPTNVLNTLKMSASLAYGNDNRVVLTGHYFDTWGTSDPLLYEALASGFSPNSNGFIAEIAYIPFINSAAPVWPWANARIGLQYTYYNKFDGTTLNAHDNNSLFLYAWIAM